MGRFRLKNSFHQCNRTKNLEKIHNELIAFKMLVSIELDTIKNMVFTMQSLCSEYFNQYSKRDESLKENFDIQFVTPNMTKTNEIFPKNSNQPCNSPFIHISSENIGNINSENCNTKGVINLKDNEFEILETLKDLQFRKTYFSNGLVTLRESHLPLHDERKKNRRRKIHKQFYEKTQKECSHKRKDINLRLLMKEMGAKSATDKLKTLKSQASGKDDACQQSNSWTNSDTVNLAPNMQRWLSMGNEHKMVSH